MKKSLYSILYICLLCFFAACGSESTDNNTVTADKKPTAATSSSNAMKSKGELLEDISTAEADLYKDKNTKEKFNFDFAKAEKLVGSYEAFIGAYPDEAAIPEYLFKSAELYRSLRNFNKSNNCYNIILSKHADYEKAPHSLFLMGFSYENDMNMPEKAKEMYQQFLKKYPNHELKDDVEFSLNNIGKTPEEIIKEFEKRRKK